MTDPRDLGSLVAARLDHLESLERTRERLGEETSLVLPAVEGAVAVAGLGIAIGSAAVAAPVVTVVGLALAFLSATLAIRSTVHCHIKHEQLAELEADIALLGAEITTLERKTRLPPPP